MTRLHFEVLSSIFYCVSVLVCSFVVESKCNTIHVDSRTGINNGSCLSNAGIPCETLDFAFTHLKDNTKIILQPGIQVLAKIAHVSLLQNIAISSESPDVKTVINCTNSGAGMKFNGVKNLDIDGVLIQHCGSLQNSTSRESEQETDGVLMFRSAVYIVNCTNVTVVNTAFISNSGVGLVMFDTNGTITIESCDFVNNSVPLDERSEYSGGGGLYIEHSSCAPGYSDEAVNCGVNAYSNNSSYFIRNSNFIKNKAKRLPNATRTIFVSKKGPTLSRLGNGGGMMIALRGHSSRNLISVYGCNFVRNHAFLGGAVSIEVGDHASENTIILEEGKMQFNRAQHGGGGFEVGVFNGETNITMCNWLIRSNHAQYGGGVAFYSGRKPTFHTLNLVNFSNCIWTSNIAALGAAVALFPDDWSYISAGSLPIPIFHNCLFSKNVLLSFRLEARQFNHTSQLDWGSGILYSDTFSVNISANVTFADNVGSCIHISAALINVLPYSNLTFHSNYALRGAGLVLVGYAALMAHENSTISFISNTAEAAGGAVYYNTIDQLDFVNSRRCFFRYPHFQSPDDWLTSFSFINNTAGTYGHSIYATTLLPCTQANGANASRNFSQVFVDWDTFTFDPLISYTIATDPATINFTQSSINASPGISANLGLKVMDDLNQAVKTVLFASCNDSGSNTSCKFIDLTGSKYISDKITVKGNQTKESFYLRVTTINNRPIGRLLEVKLNSCPPGFYLQGVECKCSDSSSRHKLPGITKCDEEQHRAFLGMGYWTGLYHNRSATAECPVGYCKYNKFHRYNDVVLLPSHYDLVNTMLCAETNRTGIACGKCIHDYTVHYHSGRFNCGKCKNSTSVGILLYILSELLPLTIIFLVVIIFDINMMSGITSSFIFFAQTMDFYQVTLPNYEIPHVVYQLTEAYWFIIGFFNLEFFRTDKLSFCLFEGATTLNVLVFKYITTAYGLLLVCILVVKMKMNVFRCHKIVRKCRKNASSNQSYTVTNGLTAFFLLTYSQCAKVSFELLSQLKINVDDGGRDYKVLSVVQLAGDVPYFQSYHLKFAIPAIIILCYLLIVPIFLTFHPLYFTFKDWMFSKRITEKLCRNSKSDCSSFTLFMKPILDAFQAPYKDDARFFAGIAFFYRLIMAGLFAFDPTTLNAFSSLLVFLVFVLMIRAIFHPFRIRMHNMVESLMFADLAFINGITLYNSISSRIQPEFHDKYFHVFLAVQLILIYMPIVGIAIYAAFQCAQYFGLLKCNKCLHKNVSSQQSKETLFDPVSHSSVEFSSSFNDSHLPARLFQDSRDSSKSSKSTINSTYGSLDNNYF